MQPMEEQKNEIATFIENDLALRSNLSIGGAVQEESHVLRD